MSKLSLTKGFVKKEEEKEEAKDENVYLFQVSSNGGKAKLVGKTID